MRAGWLLGVGVAARCCHVNTVIHVDDDRAPRRGEDPRAHGAVNEFGCLNLSLPGDAVLRDDIVWLEDYQVVTSPGRGLFRPEVRSGYAIAENGRLGVLVDEFGAELSVVRAPFAGIVNYIVATPPVSKGEPVAMISRIVTE